MILQPSSRLSIGFGIGLALRRQHSRPAEHVALQASRHDEATNISAPAKHSPQNSRVAHMNMANAVHSALEAAMELEPKSCVFGEDVAFGGVFRCTVGLQSRFGKNRCFNTPLSEQFADYIYPAFDQMVNEAAKYRYRSGGMYNVGGLTLRAPYGAVGHGGAYHSQSPESFFCHVPGLKVVIPSSPMEAKGLLLASIFEPDPVVFFEPKMMYRTSAEDVPTGSFTIPLGKARVISTGQDITLVGWGQQVVVLMEAAKLAKQEGVSCEIIDLRTLQPWDRETVIASVEKTGRLLVSHEAPLTGGFGAELVAEVTKKAFTSLLSPPVRVCGMDTPFPLVLESIYLPSALRVLEAIKSSVLY
ncbi:putative branched-chain alpha-keto acid dehydrogenase E1 beta subunit [Dunaliella salina]|uniref:3-methyl-2-oxobutanoate dehydrogenase (2-methylpropanoyl-transferring) n=1 Tax=Dunaliella salina TaxID=3046 RepID=A0ABQ7GMN4_DUNSA|nr:putative branched-chain alpha-keto acid dehydrogenase E1 beta subunit [Dunaliella salina]|eukprot:KAF5835873.1 putative branched-chain alpha-keto acid dehydrogenase E1 beta subunit [Dunaliella salina]